jgi:hypothetical protein
MKLMNAIFLVGALLLIGCTLEYPIVGVSDSYNEVISGTVTSNILTGNGTIEGTSVVLNVKCKGTTATTHVPSGFGVKGQQGVGAVTCEDGRQIYATYTVTGIPTGFGEGKDQYGNSYTFSFGMSDSEATEKVSEYVKTAATRPSLPVPRAPK